MILADNSSALYDLGFYNIGVRPTAQDLGLGARDPWGNPLSYTRLRANAIRDSVDGAMKTPTLRNIALTGPYFHNGSRATLEEVIDFYNRGGDRRGTPTADDTGFGPHASNADTDIRPLGLAEFEKTALVAFLKKSLTDDRVKFERAPFDHPELPLVNAGETLLVAAVGRSGRASALEAFDVLLARGSLGLPPVADPSGGLTGEYFEGTAFNQLRFVRNDSRIDFNWGAAGPGNSIPGANFSVRWRGQLEAPATSGFVFCATSDDGMRVEIAGQLVADAWYSSPSAKTACGLRNLVKGQKYDLTVSYYNQGAGALAQLRWWYPGAPFEIVPARYLTPAGSAVGAAPSVTITNPTANSDLTAPATVTIEAVVTDPDSLIDRVEFYQGSTKLGEDAAAPYTLTWPNAPAGNYVLTVKAIDRTGLSGNASVSISVLAPGVHGLTGTYYADLDLTNPKGQRVDSQLDFAFGTAGPGFGLDPNRYAIRWTGQLQAPTSEEYVICAESDDGSRVKIGSVTVVENYYDHARLQSCGVIRLTAGQKAPITVDYYNNGGAPGFLQLKWWRPSGNFEVIPQRYFLAK
jgi:hypothetical protein